MKRWQYRTCFYKFSYHSKDEYDVFDKLINEMGLEGWELITVNQASISGLQLFFKRLETI